MVMLDKTVTSMDRDLVLYIQVAEPNKASLVAEVCLLFFFLSNLFIYLFFNFMHKFQKSKDSTALMLSLVPSFKLKELKVELIFVVDRSGSMDGEGIEQAKKALLVKLNLKK